MSDTEHSDGHAVETTQDEYEVTLSLTVANAEADCTKHANAESLEPQSVAHVAPASSQPKPVPSSELPCENGKTVQIHDHLQDPRETYPDEYTREALPHDLVREALFK